MILNTEQQGLMEHPARQKDLFLADCLNFLTAILQQKR